MRTKGMRLEYDELTPSELLKIAVVPMGEVRPYSYDYLNGLAMVALSQVRAATELGDSQESEDWLAVAEEILARTDENRASLHRSDMFTT